MSTAKPGGRPDRPGRRAWTRIGECATPRVMVTESPDASPEAPLVRGAVVVLSLVVCLAVGLVMVLVPNSVSGPVPSGLATINAAMNASAAVCLVVGLVFIKRGNERAHRAAMLAAFTFSSLFLIGYLVHHVRVGSVPFDGQGWIRTAYFAILIPHVVLATAVVPLALLSLYRGLTGRLEAHRRIAKVTLPIWLYVSVSGVVVYFMLYRG
jgi:putative membrane protein